MRHSIDARISLAGCLWAAIYNGLWAAAWFLFMHREWELASAATSRVMPWSAAVWMIWVIMTIPLGMALMAYADSRRHQTMPVVRDALILAVLFSVGLASWGLIDGLAFRVLALDGLVNLITMPAASLGGLVVLRRRTASLPIGVGDRAI